MRKFILFSMIICTIGMVVSCNGKPTAKEVILKSYQKCQSIQGGHYEMERRMKYMTEKDTVFARYICDFKKIPEDTIFGMFFTAYHEVPSSKYTSYSLYTGNEYVSYNDSVGTIVNCDLWTNAIMSIKHNETFYSALTSKSAYPLRNEEELSDSTYFYSLSETNLDGKSCYLVDILKTDLEPDPNFGIRTIRYEINLWIDRNDYLPLQYSIAFDNVDQQDTLYQYDEYKLLAFDPNIDESKLTLASIPQGVALKDYEPYKKPEPLPEGSPAPQWSLPTLSGETLSLSDLKGKIVLLDFFYTTCAPCCAALPALQSLHEKYKDKGFVMVGIDPIDNTEKVDMDKFLSKRGITYTILFASSEMTKTYHVYAYPTLFLIDRDGNIVTIVEGFSKDMESDLEEKLVELLEK